MEWVRILGYITGTVDQELIPGGREPDSEGTDQGPTVTVGRGKEDARRHRLPARPQGDRGRGEHR
jgi:hypothetical protein